MPIRRVLHLLNSAFMLIAEPRVVRVVQFFIYVCLISAGWFLLVAPPKAFEGVLGDPLVMIFGLFILCGAVLGAVAVLPGLWWVERVGILSIMTGLGMYAVIVAALGISFFGFMGGIAFVLAFFQRWLEIRRFQLAPKRG